MSFNWQDLVVWLIVGFASGSLAGMLVKRKKQGFGQLLNLGIGMVGAVIGGALVNLFKIETGLDQIRVSVQDLLAGFVGALLLLVGVWLTKKQQARMADRKAKMVPGVEP